MAVTRSRRPKPPAEPSKVNFPPTPGGALLEHEPSLQVRVAKEQPIEKMASFLDAKVRRPGGRSTLLGVEQAVLDARARAQSGDWIDAGAKALVGLYAWCHKATYGEEPLELRDEGTFAGASRAASKMLGEHFADVPEAMAAFIKWTWMREQARRGAGKNTSRIGWRLQFSGAMLTDYRVEQRSRRQ